MKPIRLSSLYQQKVGSLLFAGISTLTAKLSRFDRRPGKAHHEAADRVIRYLYRTRHLSIQYGRQLPLWCASDASFAENRIERKSSGIHDEAIAIQLDEPLMIQCDNLQTIRLMVQEAAKLQTKLRHVDIHSHWLRQEVQRGTIRLQWQETQKMVADGLTKALNKLLPATLPKVHGNGWARGPDRATYIDTSPR
jgi:hypothetical protein